MMLSPKTHQFLDCRACIIWNDIGGEPSFDKRHWHRDTFSELYNDNALWAYSIQVLEEIRVADHTKVKDPVLRCLMVMGAWD